MNSIKVFIESGKKKTFTGALDWPGWCRSGRDEHAALQALIDYGPRYARVLKFQDVDFQSPVDGSGLIVIERHEGNVSTDFGAPAIILGADKEPIGQTEFQRFQVLLQACWQAFDHAIRQVRGGVLQKGPRGGGRNLEKMIDHVLEGDRAYLTRLAWKHTPQKTNDPIEELSRTRQAILEALQMATKGNLPETGPRGGIIWPARFFIRRVSWHVLDHTWEIEDRIM